MLALALVIVLVLVFVSGATPATCYLLPATCCITWAERPSSHYRQETRPSVLISNKLTTDEQTPRVKSPVVGSPRRLYHPHHLRLMSGMVQPTTLYW